MEVNASYHSSMVLAAWDNFVEIIGPNAREVAVDGSSLSVETIVAVAR